MPLLSASCSFVLHLGFRLALRWGAPRPRQRRPVPKCARSLDATDDLNWYSLECQLCITGISPVSSVGRAQGSYSCGGCNLVVVGSSPTLGVSQAQRTLRIFLLLVGLSSVRVWESRHDAVAIRGLLVFGWAELPGRGAAEGSELPKAGRSRRVCHAVMSRPTIGH